MTATSGATPGRRPHTPVARRTPRLPWLEPPSAPTSPPRARAGTPLAPEPASTPHPRGQASPIPPAPFGPLRLPTTDRLAVCPQALAPRAAVRIAQPHQPGLDRDQTRPHLPAPCGGCEHGNCR